MEYLYASAWNIVVCVGKFIWNNSMENIVNNCMENLNGILYTIIVSEYCSQTIEWKIFKRMFGKLFSSRGILYAIAAWKIHICIYIYRYTWPQNIVRNRMENLPRNIRFNAWKIFIRNTVSNNMENNSSVIFIGTYSWNTVNKLCYGKFN